MKKNLSLRLLLADKDKEIERLNNMLEEKFMKENTFLVENGIICKKNKEIALLKKQLEEEKNAYNRMYNMYVEKENIINELEKELKDNIDMCDGFIDTATSDLQEAGARSNGKVYYQTLLLENKIALKIYQNELNKLQELKGSDKE